LPIIIHDSIIKEDLIRCKCHRYLSLIKFEGCGNFIAPDQANFFGIKFLIIVFRAIQISLGLIAFSQ